MPQFVAADFWRRTTTANRGGQLGAQRDAAAGGSSTISAELVGGDVDMVVADTGSGIPGEDLQRILEPLFSTKVRGMGLGLAITKSIIDKHRGKTASL